MSGHRELECAKIIKVITIHCVPAVCLQGANHFAYIICI